MLIYLLRHGDAVAAPSLHDVERPLSPLGRNQATAVADFCAKHGLTPDLIWCSPLVRAQETAEPLRVLFPRTPFVTTDALVSGSRIAPLIDLVNERPASAVLLVGHEPTMSTLVSALIDGGTDFKVDFRKAMLALIETPSPVRKGRGVLRWLLPVEHTL